MIEQPRARGSDDAFTSDVVIVGAGTAGSIAARQLALAGFHVILSEAARFPRAKACGEGILPGGVLALERLGLLSAIMASGAHAFHALRYHFSSTRTSHILSFAEETGNIRGIAISREKLDEMLMTRARNAGATIMEGTRINSINEEDDRVVLETATDSNGTTRLETRFAIITAGSSNRIRLYRSDRERKCATSAGGARFGLSTHVHNEYASDEVDVFVEDGYEIYTSEVEGGRRIISILCDRKKGASAESNSGLRGRFLELVSRDRLPEWLRAEPEKIIGAVIDAAPILNGARYGALSNRGGRVLCAGDACVVTDPVAAQGLTLAILSGEAAAESVKRALRSSRISNRSPVESYAKRMRPLVRRAMLTSHSLLFLARRPALGSTVFDAISDQDSGRTLAAHGLGLAAPLTFVDFFRNAVRAILMTNVFSRRADSTELMDTIHPDKLPSSSWRFLEFANCYLSGEGVILKLLKTTGAFDQESRRDRVLILDVGGGDGSMVERIVDRFARNSRREQTPLALCMDIRLPVRRISGKGRRVRFIVGDVRRLPFRDRSVSFVVSSLMLHHLASADVPKAFAECARVSNCGCVMNDLIRSRSAWIAMVVFTSLWGDRITGHDGPVSVRRAFTPQEIGVIARAIPGFAWKVREHPFFRYTVSGCNYSDLISQDSTKNGQG